MTPGVKRFRGEMTKRWDSMSPKAWLNEIDGKQDFSSAGLAFCKNYSMHNLEASRESNEV